EVVGSASLIGRASTSGGSGWGSDWAWTRPHQPNNSKKTEDRRQETGDRQNKNPVPSSLFPVPLALVAALVFVELGAVVGRFLRNSNVMGVALPHAGG